MYMNTYIHTYIKRERNRDQRVVCMHTQAAMHVHGRPSDNVVCPSVLGSDVDEMSKNMCIAVLW